LKSSAPVEHICKPDIDNLQKAVLDALETGGAFRNDSQVTSLTSSKDYDSKAGLMIFFM
jgi:Holliday junction resolvase RusA-like endonuclease